MVILISGAAFYWFHEMVEFSRQKLCEHGIQLASLGEIEYNSRYLHLTDICIDPGIRIDSILLEWGSLKRKDLWQRPLEKVVIRGVHLLAEQGTDMGWTIPGLDIKRLVAITSPSLSPQPRPGRTSSSLGAVVASLPTIIIDDAVVLCGANGQMSILTSMNSS